MVSFERKRKQFPWNWHYHPELELTWIREGCGRRLVGDHAGTYERGDLVLLGSNLPHTWASASGVTENRALVTQFHPQAFPEELLRLPEFAGINDLLERAARGLVFRRIGQVVKKELKRLPEEEGLAGWLALLGILKLLQKEGKPVELASEGYRHHRSQRLHTRLERVTAYIEQHCGEALPLGKGAELCGLTPSAFSRFFRQMTGQTFVAYRNGCRVREATRKLVETDAVVTQIAFECGFENLANFNRRFKEIEGVTPGRYRRMRARPSETENPEA